MVEELSFSEQGGNGAVCVVENRKTAFPHPPTRSWLASLVVIFSVSFLVVALSSSSSVRFRSTSGDFSALALSKKSDDPEPFWTMVRNGYEPMDYFKLKGETSLTYKMFESHDGVVEPGAEMELYVEGYKTDSLYHYEYSVCNSDSSTCLKGKMYVSDDGSDVVKKRIKYECTSGEVLTVKTTKHLRETDEQISTFKGSLLCIYVRRELRYLTSEDLSAAMDAMYVVYSTDEEKGQEKYGSDFHNSTYYLQAHHFNAAWRDGDHIHEGLGFLPQHIKITNLFEKAMQAVDPTVTLPYWDFTIDTAADDGNYPWNSFAFSEDTFGSIIPAKDPSWGYTYRNDTIKGGRIPNGRFKKLKVEKNYKYTTTEFTELSANYGYLRAPWNANPSPYISRFAGYITNMPTCSNHYKFLGYTVLTDFLQKAAYAPHASTHGAIGGVFGCDLMDSLREQGLFANEGAQNQFCQKWSFIVKELYRKNFLTGALSGDCFYKTLTQKGQKCHYTCNSEKYENMGTQLALLISTEYTGTTLSHDQYNLFRDFICTGDGAKVFAGDHLESASPADPSFWPIHPTLERLVQAKYIMGGWEDTTWPTDAVNDYVCDKSQCYENDVLDYHASCCYGHFENDQLLDFVAPDKNSGWGLTNKEVLEALDPTSEDYSLSYIYDTFNWDHCDEDFEELILGQDESSASSSSSSSSSSSTYTYSTLMSWLLGGGSSERRI